MKHKQKKEKGQALIVIVIAMIALIGIVGLAVDGGMAFSDRRHAQNAADTSALAGAMAKINAGSSANFALMETAARDMAEDNGYNGDLVTNVVYVYTCDMGNSSCGYYSGNPNYIQVIIESYVNTYFASVLGVQQLTNRVQAVALANSGGELYDGQNIIALSKECKEPGSFVISGGAEVYLEDEDGIGGVYVNTDDSSCGFYCSSANAYIHGTITTAGGEIDMSEACSENNTGGEPSTDGDQWPFPVLLEDFGIEVPSECTSPAGHYENFDGTYDGSQTPDYTGDDDLYTGMDLTVLYPGNYSDFPPQQDIALGKIKNDILMLPGVYCVNHVIKLNTHNLNLVGKDVTFFIRQGYDFSIEGGTINLDAPDDGDYAGFLMIVEPDYGSPLLSENPVDCKITGNTANSYEGTIFAPYCDCEIEGTGSTESVVSSQLVCYTVKITGTTAINMTYDASKNAVTKNRTGLVR